MRSKNQILFTYIWNKIGDCMTSEKLARFEKNFTADLKEFEDFRPIAKYVGAMIVSRKSILKEKEL